MRFTVKYSKIVFWVMICILKLYVCIVIAFRDFGMELKKQICPLTLFI